jgi:hypothetical protein
MITGAHFSNEQILAEIQGALWDANPNGNGASHASEGSRRPLWLVEQSATTQRNGRNSHYTRATNDPCQLAWQVNQIGKTPASLPGR